jgi:hypothetical protein
MAIHTTNYFNTFIEVAGDCPVKQAEIPRQKEEEKTPVTIVFEMIKNNPYKYTSDEVLFYLHAVKNRISEAAWNFEKQKYFSRTQACLRSFPFAKRYGWGIHYNAEGKIALYAIESSEYKKLSKDKTLKIVKGTRTKRR